MKTSPASRLDLEREALARGRHPLAGVDEAGRGPLAGPVVAAAVVFPVEWLLDAWPAALADLNDSKQLSADRREHYFDFLVAHPQVRHGIGRVEAPGIDVLNILQATHQAMNEALRALRPRPAHALVDGRPVPGLLVGHTAVVRGDARSYSIAAASVLAKVTRDRLMVEADQAWPGYGFAQHKGYPTPEHLAALARLGPCPLHRRSFAPLRPPDPDLFSP
ncbi:MAG: ribonuclease HII [Verrucomicrobiota bacterium]